MNAQLRPIDVPVQRPTYDNTNVSRMGWWDADNISKLRDYWHAMGPGGDAKDWNAFCAVQWDRETAVKFEHGNTLRTY